MDSLKYLPKCCDGNIYQAISWRIGVKVANKHPPTNGTPIYFVVYVGCISYNFIMNPWKLVVPKRVP